MFYFYFTSSNFVCLKSDILASDVIVTIV